MTATAEIRSGARASGIAQVQQVLQPGQSASDDRGLVHAADSLELAAVVSDRGELEVDRPAGLGATKAVGEGYEQAV
jgi:hypothetical protein